MEAEEIKKAAANYSGLSLGFKGKAAKIESEAFIKGAEWRINSVWHKPCDIAEPGKDCLVEHIDGDGNICLRIDWRSEYEWIHAVHYDKIVRWAYIKDLLPNTKGDDNDKEL